MIPLATLCFCASPSVGHGNLEILEFDEVMATKMTAKHPPFTLEKRVMKVVKNTVMDIAVSVLTLSACLNMRKFNENTAVTMETWHPRKGAAILPLATRTNLSTSGFRNNIIRHSCVRHHAEQ